VAVVLRPPVARFIALQAWVSERGGNGARLVAAHGDLEVAGLGLDEATDESLAGIRDVLSLAGRFEFGLDERQACRANVDAPLHLARWAARPGLRRFVHVSGYRVGGMLPADEVPCRARRGVASTPSSAATRPPSVRETPPLHLPSTPLTADLPATGRSSPTSATPGTWLAAALAAARTTAAPVLVGHSLGAATILEHLAAGGQARAVVLISPFLRDVTMSPPASTR
jgi:Male sterility protein/Alpha/beta hydrolase family